MTKWKIYNEDAVEWAKNYQKGKFHALLTDAPYHLTSITKRFGKKGSAPAQFGKDGVFQRSSKGFMNQTWDGGDIAFRKETWEAFSEVLHPGAFGMAFSASRNWHRMAVAIEDAGFILHPTMFFLWVQGQGFPKATNISKQIKTRGNAEYPESDLSDEWLGHRYGLQALKPAVEPIIVFQKPYEGKPLDNIVATGAGALNIDGGRIPVNGESVIINCFTDGAKPWGNGAGHEYDTESTTQGRWPANLILDYRVEQVLVLKYNIPDNVKTTIQEYYSDYNKVQDVSEEDTNLSIKEGENKVLFQEVLRNVAESELDRKESSDVWETPHGGVSETNQQTQPIKKGKGKSKVGGALDESRIQIPERRWTSSRTEEDSKTNASQEPRRNTGTSFDNGDEDRKTFEALGTRSSLQRSQERQQGGKFRDDGQLNSQETSQGYSERVETIESRKRNLKVLACDVPEGWIKYFEETGQEVRSAYCSAARLDAQSGYSVSNIRPPTPDKENDDRGTWQMSRRVKATPRGVSDSGGASRFFYQVSTKLDESDPFLYQGKVSPKERNAGLDEKNGHPTLKPISLSQYLATLLLPPDGYAPRRIFVPFSGVASEMIGAGLAGWEHVVGVEFDKENGYVDIAEKRLQHWLKDNI